MSDIASTLLPFGPLEPVEVYSYYDFPRFFALRSSLYADVRILALCIREDEEGDNADFLYVALNEEKFGSVRSGGVPLRSAFMDASAGQLWRVRWTFAESGPIADAISISADELVDAELPTPEAALHLSTPTAPAFEPDRDVLHRSLNLGRTVVAIELEDSREPRTEFPLKWLARIQGQLQDLLTAIGQEIGSKPTARGGVERGVLQQLQMSVLPQTLAASYVFLITPDLEASGQFMESDLVAGSLSEFEKLLAACASGGVQPVLDAVLPHGPRVRGRFTDLLSAADKAGSSVGMIFAGPKSDGLSSAHLSVGQVRAALAALASAEPDRDEISIERGCLVGLDTTSGAFHLIDVATARAYKGNSTLELRSEWTETVAVGQTSFVRARIQVEKAVERPDEVEPRRYTLLELTQRDDLE